MTHVASLHRAASRGMGTSHLVSILTHPEGWMHLHGDAAIERIKGKADAEAFEFDQIA